MSTKTAAGLVAYAKAQLGRPYWYATFGNIATAQLLAYKREQNPEYYDPSRYRTGWTGQFGMRVHDCVGLIKGYLWSKGPDGVPKYNAAQDVSANGMRNACKEKGKIASLPELPGVLVFFDGHVGVYIGGGYVIEARGHDYGVVMTALNARPWTYWGKCPWIEYGSATTALPKDKTAKQQEPGMTYFKRYTGSSISIVDALKAIGADSSYNYRKKIAKANGISGYVGTAAQNRKLLNALKSGDLARP